MKAAELTPDSIRFEGLSRWSLMAGAVFVVGLLGSVGLLMSGGVSEERFWRSYMVAMTYAFSLALGGMFFVLITHLLRAGWAVAVRRVAEVFASLVLPLSLPALVIFLPQAMHALYEWTHTSHVAEDALLQHKAPWLNTTFFMARCVFYLLVWNFIAWFYLGRSKQQDQNKDHKLTLQMERFAAPATIAYALTVTFAIFDWVMTLTPHWYSTIYGVYYFSGSVLAFFSLAPLLVLLFQRAGKLQGVVTEEHFHDLGKLMFAFVVFWAYIAFSQFMLIWYANIPEETLWYKVRQTGSWTSLSLLLLFGHFFVPFLWLMSRHIKRRRPVLATASVWLLFVHYFDLYYLIMPDLTPEGMQFGLIDISTLLMLLGFTFFFAFRRLGGLPLVPVGDPRLQESLRFENV